MVEVIESKITKMLKFKIALISGVFSGGALHEGPSAVFYKWGLSISEKIELYL